MGTFIPYRLLEVAKPQACLALSGIQPDHRDERPEIAFHERVLHL